MDDNHDPIRPDELDGLFARFAALGPCALAVSGGSDSTALMLLLADWLRQCGKATGSCTVLTVDHGLRASSADEARAVGAAAVELGYRHATLAWGGPKPRSGIQAAARGARYRLMAGYMRTHGLGLLLTAHTRDDQAETLLMRLARGSGLDGLAAMAPLSPLGERGPGDSAAPGAGALWIGRPFLDVPKACLRATLEERGVRWMEDPSNIAPEFERARLRAARPHLDALGLAPDMLALSAARLARARRAIESVVADICEPRAGAVRVDPCGIVLIDRRALQESPEEVALRVVERAVTAAGGGERVPLAKLEAVLAGIRNAGATAPGGWTLARTLIAAEPSVVRIEREPGREPLPETTVSPGTTVLWDGRFRVTLRAAFAGGPVQVRALGEAGFRDLRRRSPGAEAAPARAAAMLPSIWHEGRLIAVPPLRYWAPPLTREDVGAVFVGIATSARVPNPGDMPDPPRR
jgi:tRNA(Ile)-lysidine synthase